MAYLPPINELQWKPRQVQLTINTLELYVECYLYTWASWSNKLFVSINLNQKINLTLLWNSSCLDRDIALISSGSNMLFVFCCADRFFFLNVALFSATHPPSSTGVIHTSQPDSWQILEAQFLLTSNLSGSLEDAVTTQWGLEDSARYLAQILFSHREHKCHE